MYLGHRQPQTPPATPYCSITTPFNSQLSECDYTHYNDCDPCTGTRAKSKRRSEDKVLNNERCVRICFSVLLAWGREILCMVLKCNWINLGKVFHLKHCLKSNTVWYITQKTTQSNSRVSISKIASLRSFSLFERRAKECFQIPPTTFIFPQLIFHSIALSWLWSDREIEKQWHLPNSFLYQL